MRSNARSKISEPIKEENNSQEHYEPKTSTYRNKYRRNLYLKDTELKNDDKLMDLIQDSTSSPTSLIRRNKKKTEEKKQEMLLTEPNTNSYKRTKKRHKKLNEEKINEDNNNSNSFISQTYRNHYNNNLNEIQNKKIDEKTEMTKKYEYMEINDVDKILSNDLRQIYSQIKFENLIDNMGTFDKMKKNYIPYKNTQEILDNILPPNLLVQKYTQKVNK